MGWFLDWWQSIGLIGQIMACMAIPTSIILLLQAILMLIGAGFGGDGDGGIDSDGADTGFDGIDTDGADVGFDGIDADGADAGFDGFETDGADVGFDGFDANGADIGVDGFDANGADGIDAHGDVVLGSAVGKEPAGSDSESLRILTVRGVIAFFAIGGWAGLAALTAGIPAIWSIQIALLSGVAAMILASVVIRFALRMQSSGNIDLRNAVDQIAEVYIKIPPLRSNTGKVMMLLQERYTEIDAVTDNEEAIKPYTKVVITGLASRDCLIVRPITEI